MANPQRGEVDYEFDGKHYVFKFSNAGRRATEDMLGMEAGEINQKMGVAGDRIKTGLFWGATRKHHTRDFPNITAVDNFLDDFADAKAEADDGGDGLEIDLVTSLLAAYLRQDKKVLMGQIEGEADEDEEEASGEEAPKAKKRARPPSEAGSGS